MRPRWQRKAKRDMASVDVTAFLSLMVILVPFLLITAVFSRTAILEVQAVKGEGEGAPAPDPLQLRVTVRQEVIEVDSLGQERAVRIDRTSDERALASLAELAAKLKASHPHSIEATVLLEPQVTYDVLVQVLDALRVRLQRHGNSVERTELFPLLAIGETPPTRRRHGAQ